MAREHSYHLDLTWTGNRGRGTADYRGFDRDHTVRAAGTATMRENPDGSGEFTAVTLRPHVTVTSGDVAGVAMKLHGDVGQYCFIARSVSVPIDHQPVIDVAG